MIRALTLACSLSCLYYLRRIARAMEKEDEEWTGIAGFTQLPSADDEELDEGAWVRRGRAPY